MPQNFYTNFKAKLRVECEKYSTDKIHFAKDMWMCSFFFVGVLFHLFGCKNWGQVSHLLTSKASGQHIPPTNSTKVGKKKDIPRAK